MDTYIDDLFGREILDSRGNPTVEVEVVLGDGSIGRALPFLAILVLTQATNAFSRYYAEILQTEGLNEFALTNISSISSAALANYDVVILGQTALVDLAGLRDAIADMGGDPA